MPRLVDDPRFWWCMTVSQMLLVHSAPLHHAATTDEFSREAEALCPDPLLILPPNKGNEKWTALWNRCERPQTVTDGLNSESLDTCGCSILAGGRWRVSRVLRVAMAINTKIINNTLLTPLCFWFAVNLDLREKKRNHFCWEKSTSLQLIYREWTTLVARQYGFLITWTESILIPPFFPSFLSPIINHYSVHSPACA